MTEDVGVRVAVTGAAEAVKDLGSISKAAEDIAFKQREWARIQESLTAAGAAHREEVSRKNVELEKLKAHTSDLVKKFNEQQALEETLASSYIKGAQALGSYITRLAGVTLGWAGLGAAIIGAYSAAKESEEEGKRLDAMLQATGNTVGRTRMELEAYADALAKSTKFDDESIKRGMSILLSFGNVQGEVFERAVKTTGDYAELMRTDFASAARILGRALEDPVHGLGMLGRAIGTIAPQQKEHIKLLWEQGQTVEAQNALLEILQKRFGGLSETMGGSATASSKQLGKAWNELLEEFGRTGGFVGAASGVFDTLASGMTKLTGLMGDLPIAARQAKMDMLAAGRDLLERRGGPEALATASRLNEEIIRMEEQVTKKNTEEMAKRKAAREAEATKRAQLEKDNVERAAKENEKELRSYEKLQRQFSGEMEKRFAHAQELARNDYAVEISLGNATLEDYRGLLQAQLSGDETTAEQRVKIKREVARVDAEINKEYLKQIKEQEVIQAALAAGIEETGKRSVASYEEQIKQLDRIKTLEGDERIAALAGIQAAIEEEMLATIDAGGTVVALAAEWRKVDDQIKTVLTDSDLYRKQLAAIVGSLDFEMINVARNFHGALQGVFKEAIDTYVKELGHVISQLWKGENIDLSTLRDTLTGTLKAAGKALGEAVEAELARMAASAVVQWLFGGGALEAAAVALGEAALALNAAAANLAAAAGTLGAAGGAAGLGGGVAAGAAGGALGAELTAAEMYAPVAGGAATGAVAGAAVVAGTFVAAGLIAYGLASIGNRILGVGGPDPSRGQLTEADWERLRSVGAQTDIDYVVRRPSGGMAEFATGTDSVFSSPTLIQVGEVGPERVTVSPLAGGAHRADRAGPTVVVQGPLVMDYYTMRKFTRDLGRYADNG